MKKHSLALSLVASCMFMLSGSVIADTVFSDTFDSGTVGWTAVNGYSSISTVANPGLIGTGNVFKGEVSGSVNLLAAPFASQTLSSVGNSITVAFDYRWDGAAGNTDRVPTFGLYSSGGTATDYTNDVGYNSQVVLGATPQIRIYRDVNSSDNPMTGGIETLVGTPESYTYDGTERRFTMTLERIADTNSDSNDDIEIFFSMVDPINPANNVSFSRIDTEASFTYDEFLMRSRSTDFYMDNITVTTSIPEPSSILLMLGGLGLVAFVGRAGRK